MTKNDIERAKEMKIKIEEYIKINPESIFVKDGRVNTWIRLLDVIINEFN